MPTPEPAASYFEHLPVLWVYLTLGAKRIKEDERTDP
jgi:hypothetical protein